MHHVSNNKNWLDLENVILYDNFVWMTRRIIFHGEYFIDFYKNLDSDIKSKIQYVLELIKQVDRVPKKFFAPMIGYEGLFEIRVEYQSNIFRIFCCFDQGRIVVLFNGFQKKTQKTPKKEIEKAMKLKQEYFKFKNKKS
jgi:phage-related protein